MDELWSALRVCCKVLLWDGHRRASEYFNRTGLLPEYLHSYSCFPFKILTQEILFMCFEICFLLHPRSKTLLGICWLKDCSNYFCCYRNVIDESVCSSHTDSPRKSTVHIRAHFQGCFLSVKSYSTPCIRSCNFVSQNNVGKKVWHGSAGLSPSRGLCALLSPAPVQNVTGWSSKSSASCREQLYRVCGNGLCNLRDLPGNSQFLEPSMSPCWCAPGWAEP